MEELIKAHMATLRNNIAHFIPTENIETVWFRISEEMKHLAMDVNNKVAEMTKANNKKK